MFKPDLIVCWPDTIDYPLFTKFIKDERERFAEIIISFTTTNWGEILIPKIKNALKTMDCTFIENPAVFGGKDWRDVATNRALEISKSSWVWFTEQDFFIDNPEKFWTGIEDCVEAGADSIIYFQNNERLHPSCFFIKRFVLDNFTTKNFGIVPGHDHFWQVAEELDQNEDIEIFKLTEELTADCFHHMNGLTHNLYLVSQGKDPVYKPEEFYEYLEKIKSIDE